MFTRCVAPDFVVCPESNPLWDGPVLLGLLSQLPLDEKCLLRRLQEQHEETQPMLILSQASSAEQALEDSKMPSERYCKPNSIIHRSAYPTTGPQARVASSQQECPVTPACTMSEHRDGQSTLI